MEGWMDEGWTPWRSRECRGVEAGVPGPGSAWGRGRGEVGVRSRLGPAGSDLVVESTDVQGRVPRGILGSRLSPIEEQVFQVLRVAPLAGLRGQGGKG